MNGAVKTTILLVATYDQVKNRKNFCLYCSGITFDSNHLKTIAERKNGKCLSNVYTGIDEKYIWECDKGHRWEAIASSVKRGTWCPTCNLKERLTIEELQELAESRGGKCLSKEYIKYGSKLEWMCADGHIWKDSARHVKGSGRWCPKCNKFFSEKKCRFILESIFNYPFPKNRTALGGSLELDGYNSMLNLAFEHHGKQHYEYVKHWHGTIEEFHKRQKDDLMKEELCKEKDINLIVIPYNSYGNDYELFNFIEEKLCSFGYQTDQIFEDINFNNFYKNFTVLGEIKKIADSYGGQCLSMEYIGSDKKLDFICRNGHEFKMSLNHIKSKNSWCPICSRKEAGLKRRNTIEMMKEIAILRGGKCISDIYIDDKTHLEWECTEGHRWFASPTNVKHKTKPTWCPTCADKTRNDGLKLGIDEMKVIAGKKGGKCLSEVYINNGTPLLWECEKGHQWKAVPNSVKQGTWCGICSNNVRLTIEEMKEIAKQRGGKCLSDIYLNNHTPLTWECEKGHVWDSPAARIKAGKWCEICRRQFAIEEIREKGLQEMKKLAVEREGELLSVAYINNRTHLEWQCENGHIWKSTPENIKKRWCKICKKD